MVRLGALPTYCLGKSHKAYKFAFFTWIISCDRVAFSGITVSVFAKPVLTLRRQNNRKTLYRKTRVEWPRNDVHNGEKIQKDKSGRKINLNKKNEKRNKRSTLSDEFRAIHVFWYCSPVKPHLQWYLYVEKIKIPESETIKRKTRCDIWCRWVLRVW